MKYDILVQTFTGSKTIFAFFSPKIGEKKNMLKPVSGYYKTKKKKKKWRGPLREGKTLVVRPLKKPYVSSLSEDVKNSTFLGTCPPQRPQPS